MEKWWEDKQLHRIQQECDEAIDKKDFELSLKMSNMCFEFGHNEYLETMLRASYLYCGATSILNYIFLTRDELETDEIEKMYEKCLYLYRTAKDYCKNEYDNISTLMEEEYILEKANIDGLYYQLMVNYGNLLSQCGRYVKSISNLNDIKESEFPMAVGNLALKIVDYSYYDLNHRKIMLYHAFQMLNRVLDRNVQYPEKDYAKIQFLNYKERICNALGQKYLSKKYLLTDFLDPIREMPDKELEYREWFSNNGLALNQLNDIFFDVEVGYDPLHLPSLNESIKPPLIPRFHGLFNQIKQGYVSSRFWIYEGLVDRSTHFSDKDVYLVNTLDYPVYGIGIEKIKAAYREIYSIFDKIAFFLNEYFGLKIPNRQISFNSLWFERINRKEIRRDKVLQLQDQNYNLKGLWWIYKDLRNKTVYNNKHIDPILENISMVRNAMEHRYLKVLDYFDSTEVESDDRIDNLAYTISFNDFEKLTIELLKLTREAIIQLTMIIQTEEDRKNIVREKKGEKSGFLYLHEYEDDWKHIL